MSALPIGSTSDCQHKADTCDQQITAYARKTAWQQCNAGKPNEDEQIGRNRKKSDDLRQDKKHHSPRKTIVVIIDRPSQVPLIGIRTEDLRSVVEIDNRGSYDLSRRAGQNRVPADQTTNKILVENVVHAQESRQRRGTPSLILIEKYLNHWDKWAGGYRQMTVKKGRVNGPPTLVWVWDGPLVSKTLG